MVLLLIPLSGAILLAVQKWTVTARPSRGVRARLHFGFRPSYPRCPARESFFDPARRRQLGRGTATPPGAKAPDAGRLRCPIAIAITTTTHAAVHVRTRPTKRESTLVSSHSRYHARSAPEEYASSTVWVPKTSIDDPSA